MGLFGMMNWLYTWYNPRVDPDAETLAREIGDIFLRGVRGGKSGAGKATMSSSVRDGGNGRAGEEEFIATQASRAGFQEQGPVMKSFAENVGEPHP